MIVDRLVKCSIEIEKEGKWFELGCFGLIGDEVMERREWRCCSRWDGDDDVFIGGIGGVGWREKGW